MKRINGFAYAVLIGILFLPYGVSHAEQTISLNASQLLPHVEVSFSPRSGTFVEGSTFQVPILINTRGVSINGIELRVNFDQSKLAIIQPSGGKSIIGIWTEPPVYDNSRGTASYVGVIPNGITTSAGLIGTITFRVKGIGHAIVSVRSDSSILLNDGLGSDATIDFGRAEYDIIPKAPEGVKIYSQTHPSQGAWYNNNNPVLTWDKEVGATGFSYALDNQPSTVLPNFVLTSGTTKVYENLGDGLWYFHIKAIKNGIWGTTESFLLRIDTTPPVASKPEVQYVVAATVVVERTLISFFTTDSLSGVDHYEVGVIDKSQSATIAPIFTEATSPFQVPLNGANQLRVIVRAIDKAGNVQDQSIDVQAPFVISKFITDYLIYILFGIIVLALCMLLIHYLFGRHVLARLRRAFVIVKKEEETESEHIAARESLGSIEPANQLKQAISTQDEKGNIRWPS